MGTRQYSWMKLPSEDWRWGRANLVSAQMFNRGEGRLLPLNPSVWEKQMWCYRFIEMV